jgi:hypothetical protein
MNQNSTVDKFALDQDTLIEIPISLQGEIMPANYAHHRTRVIYDAVMAIDKPPPKSPQAVKAQSQPEDSAPQSSTERRHYR